MDTPDRPGVLWTVLRRVVLGAAVGVTVLIALLVGVVVRSVTGLSFDPHGYGVFAGVLFAMLLAPVALGLWLLYRSMRRRHG